MAQQKFIEACSAAIFKDNKVLLILRSKGQYEGSWSLPGGHIESHETNEQAAVREVREETSISCEILEKLNTFKVPGNPTQGYRLHVYLGMWLSGQLHASSDALEAEWFSLQEISNLTTTPGLYKVVEEAYKRFEKHIY